MPLLLDFVTGSELKMSHLVSGLRRLAIGTAAVVALSAPALADARAVPAGCGASASVCRTAERPVVRRHAMRPLAYVMPDRPILLADAAGLPVPFASILFLGVGY